METPNTYRKGDRVRTIYGQIKTVLDAYGCVVEFYDGTWAHPTKCFPVRCAGGAS